MTALREGKFEATLVGLARKLQQAFKAMMNEAPPIEQEGRYLILTVREPDLDHVVLTMKKALPSNWKMFKVETDNDESTFEYAPQQRVGAPFVSAHLGDDADSSVVLLGTYTAPDLAEGVVNTFRKSLMERTSLHSLITGLRAHLDEKSDPNRTTEFRGKKGVWRTTSTGKHIFIPTKGAPMVGNDDKINKKVQAALAAKPAGSSAGDGTASKAEPAKDELAKGSVTPSNWRDKFKALAKKAGHQLIHPFVAMKNLATKPESRAELKAHIKGAIKKEEAHIKGAIKKEVGESKRMVSTIGRALKGEKISPEDRKQAIHQTADLVKTAMMTMAVAHIFAGGIAKALAILASPVDEVVGMAIDIPIRKATMKVFGVAHGLLPSAFYEGVESPDAVIDKVIDAILDELANMSV